MNDVSLCMIVRDAAATLPRCLDSVRGLFAETIVVDTGSTDGTQDIARSRGANVCAYPWANDFAAARNESLRHAHCPWVFWLDADEWLEPSARDALHRLLLAGKRPGYAYTLRQRSLLLRQEFAPAVDCWAPRLWQRYPHAWWQGRVHEQIAGPLMDLGRHIVFCKQVVIMHDGWADDEQRQAKLARNLQLSEQAVAEAPQRAANWYFLARSLTMARRPGAARAALHHALALGDGARLRPLIDLELATLAQMGDEHVAL